MSVGRAKRGYRSARSRQNNNLTGVAAIPISQKHGATTSPGLTYRDSGVDIDAGNALVQAIKPLTAATARPGADGSLGGFGAIFDLKASGYEDPLLISATDGVGTKLKVAIESGCHDGVGIDLVAMCVNDLVVSGGEPLFFLDYYATGRLDLPIATSVVKGIAEGCRLAGCALVGGETAEMPGLYAGGDYDLAGFAVGAVERSRLITGDKVRPGDRLIGLASSGVHSNGFSLVRRIVADSGLSWDDPAPFDAQSSLGRALIEPTRIYVRSCLALHRLGLAHAFAHITGGGFWENIPRVLPESCAAVIDAGPWKMPPVFKWLAEAGRVSPVEMARTFNLGVGMIVVVPCDRVAEALKVLTENNENAFELGEIVARDDSSSPQVVMPALDALFA